MYVFDGLFACLFSIHLGAIQGNLASLSTHSFCFQGQGQKANFKTCFFIAFLGFKEKTTSIRGLFAFMYICVCIVVCIIFVFSNKFVFLMPLSSYSVNTGFFWILLVVVQMLVVWYLKKKSHLIGHVYYDFTGPWVVLRWWTSVKDPVHLWCCKRGLSNFRKCWGFSLWKARPLFKDGSEQMLGS